jgi:Leucine-rich repeat (LRR) protein
VSDTGLAHLKGLTNLDGLHLFETQVSDTGLTHLKGLTKLAYLSLSNTRVSDAGIAVFTSMPGLTELNLSNTRVSAKGLAELQAMLPSTKIPCSEPNRTAAEAVLALGGTVHIRGDGAPGDRVVKAAADLPADYFRVTAIRLAGVKKPLGDLCTKLAALSDPKFDALLDLDLSATQANDDDLGTLKTLKQLRRLNLDSTTLRGSALTHLTALTELSELHLGCSSLTDLSAAQFGELKALKRLERLSLAGSNIGNVTAKQLHELVWLKELDLSGTKVSNAAVAVVRRALPKCRVLSAAVKK